MKKHLYLIIVLILTILLLGMVYILTEKTRYNELVASENEWNEILKDRTVTEEINIESLYFNDYPLIIDNNNNKIYYAYVDSINKDNPVTKIKTSDKDLKVKMNKKLSDDENKNDDLEIVIYNDKEYRLYTLIITQNPIINLNYEDITSGTTVGDILVIDNKVGATQKVIRSAASITLIENQSYLISMRTESVGRNKRKNDISVFGITVNHEFELINKDITDSSNTLLDLFINNEYVGVYLLEYKEQ